MDDLSQITMIEMYGEGRATLKEICERFQIHRTTVWRQLKTLRQFGRDGLVHKLKGRPSNRSKPENIRQAVLEAYRAEQSQDATTILTFFHNTVKLSAWNVSYTTVRRWLRSAGLVGRERSGQGE